MKLLPIIILMLCTLSSAFSYDLLQIRPTSTYSIIARDEVSGELGVAVQSHWFSVGSLVPWAKAGVGAIATQSFVKVEYGTDGLALMESGMTSTEALQALLAEDEGQAVRQVAMIDFNGNVATHTGESCIEYAGHIIGKNYSVQANVMTKNTVTKAMVNAFENSKGDLADKMMAALEAAEEEGGDLRGKQSASMLIVSGNPTGISWKDTKLNLSIEDNPKPLIELKRLIRIHRAYEHVNIGDQYIQEGEIDKALIEYKKAIEYYPENSELSYWSAIALVNNNRLNDALSIFENIFQNNPNLKEMTPRLFDSGILQCNKETLKEIMKK